VPHYSLVIRVLDAIVKANSSVTRAVFVRSLPAIGSARRVVAAANGQGNNESLHVFALPKT
jgi:hypothetical protein